MSDNGHLSTSEKCGQAQFSQACFCNLCAKRIVVADYNCLSCVLTSSLITSLKGDWGINAFDMPILHSVLTHQKYCRNDAGKYLRDAAKDTH